MPRTLTVAVQMDPIETVNIGADSTFALMLAAQARGHALFHYEVRHLALSEGVAKPDARREERLPPARFFRARKMGATRRAVLAAGRSMPRAPALPAGR